MLDADGGAGGNHGIRGCFELVVFCVRYNFFFLDDSICFFFLLSDANYIPHSILHALDMNQIILIMKCQNTEHYQVNMKHKFSYINLSIHPPPNYLRTDWGAFVKLQAKAWLEMAVNWTTQAEAGRLRVLHYEELKEDPIPLLEDVLRFRGLDVDPLRLKCLKVLLLVFFFFFLYLLTLFIHFGFVFFAYSVPFLS